ncbi:MAG: hypothetical protein ACHQET_03605 [Chitinophagales bacterium]
MKPGRQYIHRFGGLALSVMGMLALGWSTKEIPPPCRLNEIRDSVPHNKNGKDIQNADGNRAIRRAKEAAEQAARAFEGIDWKSIQDRIKTSVDLEKIEQETRSSMQRALKNIDLNEVRAEIDRNAGRLDEYFNGPEFQKQLDEIKKLDDKKIKKVLDKADKDLENGLEQLRREWSKEKKDAKEPA